MYLFQADSTVIELCGLYDTTNQNFGTLTFTSSTSQAEGWHFVGNPFPSALRWSEVFQPTGVNGNYAVWSVQDGNYRTWNGSIGSAGDIIPPFQGFWMKVNQGLNQDFILSNSCRDTGEVNQFGKKSSQQSHIQVKVSEALTGFQDAVFFSTSSEVNESFTPKLFGRSDAPQIWMQANQADTVSILTDTSKNIHPIYLRIPKSGMYSIQLSYEGSGKCEWEFYDSETGDSHPINTLTTMSIQLEVGYYPNRFSLRKRSGNTSSNFQPLLPDIRVIKPYIYIQNLDFTELRFYSLDGRLLGFYLRESPDSKRFGPIPYSSGIYLIEIISQHSTSRQLIYLP